MISVSKPASSIASLGLVNSISSNSFDKIIATFSHVLITFLVRIIFII